MNKKKKPVRLSIAQAICRLFPPLIAQRLRRNWLYPETSAKRDHYEFCVRSVTGSLFRHHTNDFHAYPFSTHGYYEWRSLAIALALCSPGDTLIEVGANIGTETLGFADIVGDHGKVFAFEPIPACLEKLRSLAAYKKNILVQPYAVSDRIETAQFAAPKSDFLSGTGHFFRDTDGPEIPTLKVESVTLDSLADTLGQATVIFMDTEGMDTSVIRGGQQYIRKNRPAIICEAYADFLDKYGSSMTELYETISALNYRCFKIGRFGLERNRPGQSRKWADKNVTNWYCEPDEKPSNEKRVNNYIRRCGWLPCIKGLNPMVLV